MMEDVFVVSNWTKWESYSSPEDEYWFWERIPPEVWFSLKDVLFWLPATCVIAYCLGIQHLHNYMKTRDDPVDCRAYRISYNLFVTAVSIFLAYKCLVLMPLPNVFTSEGLYTFLCVRRPLKNALVSYGAIGIFFRIVHILDTVFIVLDKKPPPGLQMLHHTVALLLPNSVIGYGEPYVYSLFMIVALQHCILYPLSTIKAFGVKLPKWVSVFALLLEGGVMLFGCLASLYAANVIQRGGDCYRHPQSALLFNCSFLAIGMYVMKVLASRFILGSKSKVA